MSAEQPARFVVRIGVRSYEMDVNGHVNHAVYHQYAEHARMEHFRASGLSEDVLAGRELTVVLLSTTVHFRAELRAGETLEVDSEIAFTRRKPFTMSHRIRRIADRAGTPVDDLAAEVECTMGVLDVGTRRLVADPHARLSAAATEPALLGPVPD
ncbi:MULTISPECIES: acyl-CoA thioesterase [Pseudonocardia]|uniref:Acyl-CoA thioesterase YbgC n=2 Tax=Pseudonocardia TaxID=1847 RepID=A0A1Y2MMS9_PSEAH|nr:MULTISPECIES: acyl-CoA thioesterase [Pseudonocardia]OSY36550.1 acyl-CoA thioesterase YbgC [Pseudonocardia autotrophica]TDN76269.1 acyl-CoA thioester hydrolase [Pseudonocardia autotrophica]BBG00253.1 thioesterase [Pseudonocardia autotrophica]